MWLTMYPLPRIVITATFFVALAYGVVAVFVLLPTRDGEAIYYVGFPIAAGVGVMLFAPGEPSDQVSVHVPRTMSEAEFDALEDRVEHFAEGSSPLGGDDRGVPSALTSESAADQRDFMELVAQAICDLPPRFAQALDHVAVVVSDQGSIQRVNGRLQPLYGLYIGYAGRGPFVIGSPSGDPQPDRIVIFRDTLAHDYGSDRERLRQEVTRTLRHELGHHLGFDEHGVDALGL